MGLVSFPGIFQSNHCWMRDRRLCTHYIQIVQILQYNTDIYNGPMNFILWNILYYDNLSKCIKFKGEQTSSAQSVP